MATTLEEIVKFRAEVASVLADPNSTDLDIKRAKKRSMHIDRLEQAVKMTQAMLAMR